MLDAIARAQCKDLRESYRLNAKKIAKTINLIPAIFRWYEYFPREWEIEQLEKFNEMVENTIAIEEQLSYLNDDIKKLQASIFMCDKATKVQKIGFELFLHISKEFNLQSLLKNGEVSSYFSDICEETKRFLKRNGYDVFYFLQYGTYFSSWSDPLLASRKRTATRKNNMLQIKKGLHIATAGTTLLGLKPLLALKEAASNKSLGLSKEELFHISNGGDYLDSYGWLLTCKIRSLQSSKAVSSEVRKLAMQGYKEELAKLSKNGHAFNKDLLDHALLNLNGKDNTRNLSQELNIFSRRSEAFA